MNNKLTTLAKQFVGRCYADLAPNELPVYHILSEAGIVRREVSDSIIRINSR